MGALESILPAHITGQAIALEDREADRELVLPYAQALQTISIATEHLIVILGLDAFEVRKEGLLTVSMTDASKVVRYTGDWDAYVAIMNAQADRWLREHRLGENHGYILTSASKKEFGLLTNNLKQAKAWQR